jgi:mycofactocin precursor peptide peptidase
LTPTLSHAAWTDLDAVRRPIILAVPLGSTEQHGPHLPLSTDTDIALALAEGLAERRDDTWVGPAIPVGSSGEHQAFPGTLSIGGEAVTRVLVELGRSASAAFDRLVLVSAHGGNATAVADAAALLSREQRRVLAWSPGWSAGEHAGIVETSVMLAIRSDLVRADYISAGNTVPVAELMPALVADGVRSVSATGVLGDPTAASAELGSDLLQRAVTDLAETVATWAGP